MIGDIIKRSVQKAVKIWLVILIVQFMSYPINWMDISFPCKRFAINILYLTGTEMNPYIATPLMMTAFFLPGVFSGFIVFVLSLFYEVQKQTIRHTQ